MQGHTEEKHIIPINIKILIWSILIVGLIPTVFEIIKAFTFGTWNEVKLYIFPAAIFSLVVTASIFLANIFISGFYYGKFPDTRAAVKRIFSCLITALLISNVIIFLEWEIYNSLLVHLSGDEERKVIFSNQVIVTVLVTIVNLVFEMRHYLLQWRNSAVEAERLQKENTLSQLESLRTQISPHFLFNSFNALQSLIDSDTQKAKDFLQELSKVYRYVLEHRDDLVVEIKDELSFIQSYIYLNKIRFGENLRFDAQIDAHVAKQYIPPLTLQLLIENAIKHNIISSEKPLYISILNEGESLIIKNNLQLRTEKMFSTGIGLKNLQERYRLIYNIEPEFTLTKDEYIAKIPVIEKEMI